MSDTQSSPNGVNRRYQQPQRETPVRGVRQDKPRVPTAPRSLTTASPAKKSMRPASIGYTNVSFTKEQQKHSTKRQKVKLSIWVDPHEKTELERVAESEGLSISHTGRGMIVDGIRQRLRIEREVFAQPILETTIRKELRRSFSHIIVYQARIAMTLDVIKGLVKWLCRRLAGATKEQVDEAEKRSRTDARVNVQTRTPQLERICQDLEQTLMGGLE